MSRKKQAMDLLFDCFVREGRELGYLQAQRLYPREMANIRKVAAGSNVRILFSRMRKIYADRWHEIYDKKVNIVREKPVEEVSEPTPLERLRVASRKENE